MNIDSKYNIETRVRAQISNGHQSLGAALLVNRNKKILSNLQKNQQYLSSSTVKPLLRKPDKTNDFTIKDMVY